MAKNKPKKPKKTRTTQYEGYKYTKPTTKNQREWNKQIERLERYAERHKGLDIKVPEKPTRITAKTLKELSAYKGRKILEQASITVPGTNGQIVQVNAKEYLDNIVPKGTAKQREQALKEALRKKIENEPRPKTDVEPAEQTLEQPTEEPTEYTPIEEDSVVFYDDIRSKMTTDELTINRYFEAIQTFEGKNAPMLREMMTQWYDAISDELSQHEIAEIMQDLMYSGNWIDRDVAYDLVIRGEWLTHFTSLIKDDSLRAWFYDYIQTLYSEQVGMTLEEIQDSY